MNYKQVLSLLMFVGVSPIASADIIGFEVGLGIWHHAPSGHIAVGGDDADLEDDFDLSSEAEVMIWAALEHPVPLIPNFKLKHTSVTSEGDGTLDADITIGDTTFSGSAEVAAELDLTQLDATLYYEILDNWINLDIGLTARRVTGNLFVEDKNNSSNTEDRDFNVVIPMLYGAARFDLPFTGFRAGVEVNSISFDGNKFMDFALIGSYETDLGLGAQLGYRTQNITLDDVDDVDADIKLAGFFAAAYYHF